LPSGWLWRSVKHEDVYLKGYATMGELVVGLADYFVFYNGVCPHQSLENETPDVVYRTAISGGAMILDKYPRTQKEAKVETATSEKASIIDVKTEEKQERNRGSAVQLQVKSGVQLKLDTLLS